MKRLLAVIVILSLLLGAALPLAAQDGPSGTWLGTWPYAAPGTHNLNAFSAGGTREPINDSTPSANAMSVAAGIAQPLG